MMLIGSCEIKLYIPTALTLKDKRRTVKSLLQKSKNKFNLSAAEIDAQDYLQTAVIGVAFVANDYNYLQSLIDKYQNYLESFPDFSVVEFKAAID